MKLNLTITAKERAKKALAGVAGAATKAGTNLKRAGKTGGKALGGVATAATRAGASVRRAGASASSLGRLGAAAGRLNRRLAETARRAAAAAGRRGLGALRTGALAAARGVGFLAGKLVGLVGTLVGLASAAASGLFGFSVGKAIKNASDFEQLQFTLEGITGSAAKAAVSVKRLRAFMADSPVDGDQLIAAYTLLRQKKIDVTRPLFGSLQDAALAKGKEVTEAAEAFVGAMNGSYDALGESFGIAVEEGGRGIVITYDKAGKKMVKGARKNAKDIREALEKALSDKFAGATDRYRSSLAGMWGSLQSGWNEFLNTVADNGLFDWVKEKVGSVLAVLTKMAKSGELKAWAKTIADKLLEMGKAAEEFIVNINWKQFGEDLKTVGQAIADIASTLADAYRWGSGLADKLNSISNFGGDVNAWFRGKLGMAPAPGAGAPAPGVISGGRAGAATGAALPRILPGAAKLQKMSGTVDINIRTASGLLVNTSAKSDGPVKLKASRGQSMAGFA